MGLLLSKTTKNTEEIEERTKCIKNRPVIFVSGIPGAGNRTASETLSAVTGYETIFPGDLIRNRSMKVNVRPQSNMFINVLKKREKIPDKAVVKMIKEEMLRHENAKGFIISGFPRSVKSSSIFNREVKNPEKVVALRVADEVAAIRLEHKLSQLGKPEREIMKAENIVRSAIPEIKKVHKSFDDNKIIAVNSSTADIENWNKAIETVSCKIKDSLQTETVEINSSSHDEDVDDNDDDFDL